MDLSCLCGTVSDKVRPRITDHKAVELSLSHSDVDRYSTGLLCVSYYPIEEPKSLNGTRKRSEIDGWTRYFCSVCGCHVFRSRSQGRDTTWEVATGVINEENSSTINSDLRFVRHTSVGDTKDGGISLWLRVVGDQTMEVFQNADSAVDEEMKQKLSPEPSLGSSTSLPASCACGTVRFHISRPNEESFLPHSGYPDLQYAACAHSPEFMRNPSNDKWWIRADGTKYLAGTCACRSCRLISGFEIQTWAFVPRKNIFFHVSGPDGQQSTAQLDFKTLPPGILQTYASSSGVLREFCGNCGATVFWHDEFRPDVMDISVGLFRAKEGARAETWLDWWTERCSFEEETERDRTGAPARVARELIDSLERGLQSGVKEV